MTIAKINKRKSLGHIIKFDKDFECSVNDGIFEFGDIIINTRGENDENDDFDLLN